MVALFPVTINWRLIKTKIKVDGWTDGRTDGQTDIRTDTITEPSGIDNGDTSDSSVHDKVIGELL